MFQWEDLGRFQTANQKMKAVVLEARRIAKTINPVMILGEPGSGRRELAFEIVESSPQADGRTLRWSQESRDGLSLRHQDTIIVECVEQMNLEEQRRLLDAVAASAGEGCRWIATGSRDLVVKVRKEQFLLPLFQRLAVQTLWLPSLKERGEDLTPLAQKFVQDLNAVTGKNKSLSIEAVKALRSLDFSRNVEDLYHWVQRSYFQAMTESIGISGVQAQKESSALTGVSLSEMERKLILQTLEMTEQNRTKAAEILGISIRTLRNKLHEYREQEEASL